MLHEAFDAADLGRAIKRLRKERGMTQQTVADWCGVSRQTVVALEQGGPVALTVATKAIALLGAKLVVARKNAMIGELDTR